MVKDNDKPEDGPSPAEKRRNALTSKLTGSLLQNVNAMGTLQSALGSLHKAQANFSKSLITTGNKQLGGLTQLHKTFHARGLGMEETIALNTQILETGIASYDKNTRAMNDQKGAFTVQKKLLAEYSNLGKDTKGLTKLMASNQQVLGISTTQTSQLAEHTAALGVTYGFNSDKLISAMNQLSKTWVQSVGTFGKDVTLASQKAISTMLAEYGPEASAQINNLANTLLNGSKEASITATRLGLDLSKLHSTNSAVQVAELKKGLNNLSTHMAGATGPEAGFYAQDLAKALGGNEGMLALSKMEPQSRAMVKTSIAQQAADARRNNAMANMNEAIKDIVVALLPAIQIVATALAGIAKVMSILKYQISLIVLLIVAQKTTAMAKAGMSGMKQMMMMSMMMGGGGAKGAGAAASVGAQNKAVNAKIGKQNFGNTSWKGAVLKKDGTPDMRNATNKATAANRAAKAKATSAARGSRAVIGRTGAKMMGGTIARMLGGVFRVLLGPWGIALSFLIGPLFSMFSDSSKEADKDRKKTNSLLDKPSKQATQLATIAQTLSQNNIYSQQLILQGQENNDELRKTNEPQPRATDRNFSTAHPGGV